MAREGGVAGSRPSVSDCGGRWAWRLFAVGLIGMTLALLICGSASSGVPVGDFTLIKGGNAGWSETEPWARLFRGATVKVIGTTVSDSYHIAVHDAANNVDFPVYLEMTGTHERTSGKISGLYSISSDEEYDYPDLETFPNLAHRRCITVSTGAFSGEIKGDEFDGYCALRSRGKQPSQTRETAWSCPAVTQIRPDSRSDSS